MRRSFAFAQDDIERNPDGNLFHSFYQIYIKNRPAEKPRQGGDPYEKSDFHNDRKDHRIAIGVFEQELAQIIFDGRFDGCPVGDIARLTDL